MSSKPIITLLLFVGIISFPMVGAAAPQHTDSSRIYRTASGNTLKQYFFVMLKNGPKRDQVKDTAIINKIQAGHMANISRLAKGGKLIVAGPFGDDTDWRGIFIFDCNTQTEVEDLVKTDPAISSGRLAYEIHPWWTQKGTVIK